MGVATGELMCRPSDPKRSDRRCSDDPQRGVGQDQTPLRVATTSRLGTSAMLDRRPVLVQIVMRACRCLWAAASIQRETSVLPVPSHSLGQQSHRAGARKQPILVGPGTHLPWSNQTVTASAVRERVWRQFKCMAMNAQVVGPLPTVINKWHPISAKKVYPYPSGLSIARGSRCSALREENHA